ncbi:MAG: hypothetical protein ACRDUA_15900 [Micromonosporaceae bacterium]
MADEYGAFQDATNPDTEWDIRTVVVRLEPGTVHTAGWFDSGGPYIHANATHCAVGVTGVEITDTGALLVTTDGGSPIGAVVCSPDETLTARGIDCGPSGGASNTHFVFYKENVGRLYLNTQTHWDMVASPLSNVWITWLTPKVRGTGQPSKATQALAALGPVTDVTGAIDAAVMAAQAELQVQIDELTQKVAELTPGTFARFNLAHPGLMVGDFDTEHPAPYTFADFAAEFADV